MILPLHYFIHWKSVFNFKNIAVFLLCIISFQSNGQEWGEEVSSDGSVPIHRHECAYIEVNGKFYLIGGRKAGIEKYVNIYDPASKKWTQGATTDIPIHHFQPVVYNNKIYVIGAFTGNFPSETPVANVYIYDPASDTWTKGSDIPEARRRGSAGVVLYNNKMYVVGGITNGHSSGFVKWLDEYDPATNTWTVLTDAPRERDHFQAAVIDNKLILAGGRQTSTENGSNKVIKEVDVYDFSTSSWSTKSNITTARAGTAAVVAGNELYIIGGEGPNAPGGKAHKETEAYSLTTDSWRSVALLITGRHATGAIYNNGKIYIAAGSSTPGGNAGSELTSQEVLVLTDNSNVGKLLLDATVNFGQVINKDRKEVAFTIRNISSNKDVTVSQITLGGANDSEFSLKNSSTPPTIKAGESIDLIIVFEPTSIGDKVATLTITHDGEGGGSSVNISGESVLTITSTLNAANNPVKIYPNPFTDKINIDLSKLTDNTIINIYDAFGKPCSQQSSYGSILELNSANLLPGIYYMHISQPGNDSVQIIKLVKK